MKRFALGIAAIAATILLFAQSSVGQILVKNYFVGCQGAACDNIFNITGSAPVTLGAGGLFRLAGDLASNVTSVGNTADTNEDNLQTYSLPANSLSGSAPNSAAPCLYIFAAGSTGANADSKDVKLYFGATVVAQVLANAANAKSWYVDAWVCRSGANTQIASGSAQVDATAAVASTTTPAETDTGAIVIKVTGKDNTAATANSVVSKLLIVQGSR